jgi:hypothetical protein
MSADELYNDLISNINKSSLGNFIISSEAYYLISTDLFLGKTGVVRLKDYLQRIKGKCMFKIILYVRRQDEYVESLYNQFVKTHNFWSLYSGDINQFISEKYALLDFARVAEIWRDVFPDAEIIVREYIKGQTNSVKDFCQIVGIPFENLDLPEGVNYNESLNKKGLAVMRVLNKVGIDKSTPSINGELTDLVNSLRPGQSGYFSLLSDVQKTDLLLRLKDSNDVLWKEYLGKDNPWMKVDDGTSYTENVTTHDMAELIRLLWNKYIQIRFRPH